MEISSPHVPHRDQRALLCLAVFQNLRKPEYIRSVHGYSQNGSIRTIQQEFFFKPGAFTQISRPTYLACLSSVGLKQYMEMLKKAQEREWWNCILDFYRDSPLGTTIIPLLNNSRNPDLQSIPSLAQDLQLVESFVTSSNVLFSDVANGHEKDASDWQIPQCILPSLSSCLQEQGLTENMDQHRALESPDGVSQKLQLDLWQKWGSDLELASPRISQAFDLSPLRRNISDASTALHEATPSPASSSFSSHIADSSSWAHHTLARRNSHTLLDTPEWMPPSDGSAGTLTGFPTAYISQHLHFDYFLAESPSSCNMPANELPLDSNKKLLIGIQKTVDGCQNMENGCHNQICFDGGTIQKINSTSNICSSSEDKSLEAENFDSPDQSNELDWGVRNVVRKVKKTADSHRFNHSRATTERLSELTKDELSQYFNMPITQASKLLKVGLTVLKKRCRVFGIPRWPHRKMKSLNSLINNIQDLAKEDGANDANRIQVAVKELEEQRKEMEERPGTQLAERTKRLRQACFKASYRKRRQEAHNDHNIIINGSNSNSSSNSGSSNSYYNYCT